jgi:hypothetical protein
MSEQDEQEQQPMALADRLAALRSDDPADGPQEQPAADAEPESDDELQDERPAEGYDPQRGAFVKTYSLGTAADLHSLSLDEVAAHDVTAALPDGAARAAQDAGYKPAGAAELIDVRRNGNKTDLSYAVPADARG